MARHKVEICGVNTANLKVLSNHEMTELFKKYNEGDKFAKEDLVNGNLKLVLSILRKYNNRCDNMDDLFQVGCIGLIKAIDNFDLSFDVKFSTYCCWNTYSAASASTTARSQSLAISTNWLVKHFSISTAWGTMSNFT